MPKLERVITIDDNENDLLLTKRALEEYNPRIINYTFPEMGNGLYFLQNYQAHGIQMVFIDLYLQNHRKSTDFIDEIRQYTNNVPIVVVTYSDSPKDIMEAYKYNICKYVLKPVSLQVLTQLERYAV